jgi:hypothetical protein
MKIIQIKTDRQNGEIVAHTGSNRYVSQLMEPQSQLAKVWSHNFSIQTTLTGLLFLILSSILFTSCEDIIEVKLNDENLNLIGVEASISSDDEPRVFLYKTLKVNQNESYPAISNAKIQVTDNATPANSIFLEEVPAMPGNYTVPSGKTFMGIAGREYRVTIQTQGITLSAQEKLKRVESIDSMKIMPSMRGNGRFIGVFTYGKEPKGVGNYYKWDLYVNDILVNDANRMAIASDEFVDGNYISKLEVYTDFYQPEKEATDRKLRLHDVVTVKQTSISEFAYNFYFQMINQSSGGSLFSVPPANIRSNFTSSDGKPVLGIFTARDVSVSNKITIDEALEKLLKR